MSDYLELPIDPEYYYEDTTFDVWVYLRGQERPVVLKDIRCVTRNSGFWAVNATFFSREMTAYFVSEDVLYLTVFVNEPTREES